MLRSVWHRWIWLFFLLYHKKENKNKNENEYRPKMIISQAMLLSLTKKHIKIHLYQSETPEEKKKRKTAIYVFINFHLDLEHNVSLVLCYIWRFVCHFWLRLDRRSKYLFTWNYLFQCIMKFQISWSDGQNDQVDF